MTILGKIEAILFVASKPLTIQKLASATGKQPGDIADAIENLKLKYNRDDSGMHILTDGDTIRLGTNAAYADAIEGFMKDEVASELTKAQLETLTVIAYRSPITRPELEEIRGVNCSIILRNLLMRGLITEGEDEEKILPVYALSMEALRHLGITDVTELPDYESLHMHPYIEQTLSEEPAE